MALEEWANSAMTGGLRLRNPDKLPRWAKEVRRMFVHFPCTNVSRQGSLVHRMVEPAIAYARAELRQRLRQKKSRPFPGAVLRCFEKQLENRLSQTMKACLDRHWQAFEAAFRCVFREQGEIQRAEIESEFFKEHAGNRLVAFLQSFPALAKLWSQLIGNWLQKVIEVNARLGQDRHALRKAFFNGRDPGDLVDVTVNISDPHRGGRETMILCFRNGRVVYKPRSGESESDWFSFARWVNRQGFAPPLRILRFLQRPEYCWAEFVEHLPCSSKKEAHRYYRRAGGLICAAYLLGAIDCHRDNLIAARDQPVLIDTETFFHPEAGRSSPEKRGSVTRTGLLPMSRSLSRFDGDIGAFATTGVGKHTPVLKQKGLAPTSYVADVLRGFRDMWAIIGEARAPAQVAFRRRLRRLTDRPWRRIYRSTKSYFEIRDRSVSPDALRSGLGRSRAIARDLLGPGVSAPIVLQEIGALGRWDVPYFLEPPCDHSFGADSLSLSDLLAHVRSALLL
jgi:lantibiotic modifying enzyme